MQTLKPNVTPTYYNIKNLEDKNKILQDMLDFSQMNPDEKIKSIAPMIRILCKCLYGSNTTFNEDKSNKILLFLKSKYSSGLSIMVPDGIEKMLYYYKNTKGEIVKVNMPDVQISNGFKDVKSFTRIRLIYIIINHFSNSNYWLSKKSKLLEYINSNNNKIEQYKILINNKTEKWK